MTDRLRHVTPAILLSLVATGRVAIGATVTLVGALGLAVVLVPHHVPGLTIPG